MQFLLGPDLATIDLASGATLSLRDRQLVAGHVVAARERHSQTKSCSRSDSGAGHDDRSGPRIVVVVDDVLSIGRRVDDSHSRVPARCGHRQLCAQRVRARDGPHSNRSRIEDRHRRDISQVRHDRRIDARSRIRQPEANRRHDITDVDTHGDRAGAFVLQRGLIDLVVPDLGTRIMSNPWADVHDPSIRNARHDCRINHDVGKLHGSLPNELVNRDHAVDADSVHRRRLGSHRCRHAQRQQRQPQT